MLKQQIQIQIIISLDNFYQFDYIRMIKLT